MSAALLLPAAALTGPPVSPVQCVHAQPGAGSSAFCSGSPIPFGLPLAAGSAVDLPGAGRWALAFLVRGIGVPAGSGADPQGRGGAGAGGALQQPDELGRDACG